MEMQSYVFRLWHRLPGREPENIGASEMGSKKRRMEEGVVFGRSMLGYDVRNGKCMIMRKETEVVTEII